MLSWRKSLSCLWSVSFSLFLLNTSACALNTASSPLKTCTCQMSVPSGTMEGITCGFSLVYYYFSEENIILQVRPSPMSRSTCVCGIFCSTLLLFAFNYPGMGIRSQSIKTYRDKLTWIWKLSQPSKWQPSPPRQPFHQAVFKKKMGLGRLTPQQPMQEAKQIHLA